MENNLSDIPEKVLDKMEELSSEMKNFVDACFEVREENMNIPYQDFVNQFYLRKIAELELDIEYLNRNDYTIRKVNKYG